MIVGTVKEIKTLENRVGLTPMGVKALIDHGHKVLVETRAGVGSGFSDEMYEKAGARVMPKSSNVYGMAEMVVKVKEPQKAEFNFLKKGLILFTYLHLAAEKEVTEILLKNKVIGVAYETVELGDSSLPLLTPMSEVAGRMAVTMGQYFLTKPAGGMGRLLAGVPGVMPGNVVILGSGVVSVNAAKMALGLNADVTIVGRNLQTLRYLDDVFGGKVRTLASNSYNIENAVINADLVVGGVLITGAKAPKLVTREMISKMKKGSVVVDVAIDQGGCFETSKPTSHANPVYEVDGVIHYCVTNMPGAVPMTSTLGLTNATLPYALAIADRGLEKAIKDDALYKGVNTYNGKLTYAPVAEAFGMKFTELKKLI
jgi:alanine dehydrogenase